MKSQMRVIAYLFILSIISVGVFFLLHVTSNSTYYTAVHKKTAHSGTTESYSFSNDTILSTVNHQSNPFTRLCFAYHEEIYGDIDAALQQYRHLAETSTGSEQIGAINRYCFAMRRKHAKTNGLKNEIQRLKNTLAKDDFEWIFISQYSAEGDPRKCYRILIEKPDSPFASYAKLNLLYYYSPLEQPDVKVFAQQAIDALNKFIDENPGDAYVPHAKIRIGACLEQLRKKEEAIALYRTVLEKYQDDAYIYAACINGLFWLQQLENSDFVKKNRNILKFYGTLGNGYFMPEHFDPGSITNNTEDMITILH